MKASLRDKLQDEHARLDIRRGGGLSKQAQTKRFLTELQRRGDQEDKSMCVVARERPTAPWHARV
eukprot:scaffold1273_cov401-Prasinococcus_capsulatus_cf.AAC.7